ncbi:tetraspanin-18-like isoform X3 [Corythoichthys intestinalis]|uniref:tetraspanin-18-like isoform X3 n=1 Tax=Corythoichthys intestinalis TaxID=161448 RepID=UPI0025A517D4|nr:tetraspanin-18-like isoform X3 [Corythoichthys intestinalis]
MMRTRIEPAAYGQHTPNVECADHYPATRYYKKAKIRTQTTGDCLSCIKYTLLILNTFFVFCMLIFVVLIVEMAGIGLVLVDRSEFEEKTMSDNMKSKFGAEFTKANQDYVEAWRAVMRHYECCGISRDDFTPENVPRCCRVDDKDICDDTTPTHKQPCYDKIKKLYDNGLYGGIGFLLVVVVCEVTAIAIAICFFRGLQHV